MDFHHLELCHAWRTESYNFSSYLSKINSLLDNIVIERSEKTFRIINKQSNDDIKPELISSGEAELISLGIECLVFEKQCKKDKNNIIFLDEPDVHIHADLQVKLCHFLYDLFKGRNVAVIIATHSTSILGALESYEDVYIEFMTNNQIELNFKKILPEYKKILPIFGAHPLSNIFNQMPIFLVDGEDDERIWQQAIRSSNNRLKIYPCSVDGEGNMSNYEKNVIQILSSVYDKAKGYSLRDRDDSDEIIDDLQLITRFKLSCRTAENLLLSDEVLKLLGISWETLKDKIGVWLSNNKSHSHYQTFFNFKNTGFNRKDFDLKEIRNDLMGIIASPKPWEVVVGQTIGGLISRTLVKSDSPDSILNYLGNKLVRILLPNV